VQFFPAIKHSLMKSLNRLAGVLNHRRFTWVLLITLFILKAPTWDNSLEADDYQQRNLILGSKQLHAAGIPANKPDTPLSEVLLNYFAFATGEPAYLQGAKEYGVVPWWTDKELKVRFLRPIAAFTHWLDYQLWPNLPSVMRAHNLIWFLLCLGALTLVYRRFIPNYAVASLALLIYAVDISNSIPIFWIANRNALIALFFSLLTLYLHDRARQQSQHSLIPVSLLCLVLSLLSAEAGIGTMAFIAAYELCLTQGSLIKRGLYLIPYGLVIVVWRLCYSAAGFGAKNTGLYIDPADSGHFIQNLLVRLPLLVAEQFTGMDGIDHILSEQATMIVGGLSVVLLLFLAYLLLPLLKQSASVRFWFFVTVFAAAPVSAVAKTHGRLLMYVGVGGAALIAEFMYFAFAARGREALATWKRRVTGGVGIYFILVHLVISVVLLLLVAVSYANNRFYHGFRLSDAVHSTTNIGLEESSAKHVILVTNPDPHGTIFIPYFMDYFNLTIPLSVRTLAPAFDSVDVMRVEENVLLISAEKPFPIYPSADVFNKIPYSGLYSRYALATALRGDRPFTKEVYNYAEMQIAITDLRNDYPRQIRVTLKEPMDSANLRWLYWNWAVNSYRSFDLPKVGESISIPGPALQRN